MGYNYKENLKAFIENNNMTGRVMELMINKLRTSWNDIPEGSFDEILEKYLSKSHRLKNYDEFFNHLCSWSSQPEYRKDSSFWTNLHHNWQLAVRNGIVLTKLSYKSIW